MLLWTSTCVICKTDTDNKPTPKINLFYVIVCLRYTVYVFMCLENDQTLDSIWKKTVIWKFNYFFNDLFLQLHTLKIYMPLNTIFSFSVSFPAITLVKKKCIHSNAIVWISMIEWKFKTIFKGNEPRNLNFHWSNIKPMSIECA